MTRHLLALVCAGALAGSACAAAVIPPANTTAVLPSGPVSDASLAAPLGFGRPGPGWYETATPDIQLHVDTIEDPTRPCIILTWTPRDRFAGHAVERAELATGPWVEIGALAKGVTSTLDRQLDRTHKYYYRVIAVRGTLRSHPSTVVEVDLPTILEALDQRAAPGAARRPSRRSDTQPHDADGTAFLMALMLVRSFVKRRRV